MSLEEGIVITALVLIAIKFIVFWRLELLNQAYVRKAQRADLPSEARDIMGAEKYKRSLEYTLEKSKLSVWEKLWGQLILIVVLGSGLAGAWFTAVATPFLSGTAVVWSESFYIFSFFFLYGLLGLPFSLYRTFRLEAKYGFNTMTWGLYGRDFIKSTLLSALFMIPLLAGVFYLYREFDAWWWVYAAALVIGFQFLSQLLFPRFILPLFNKLQPLAAGELRDAIFALAKKTDFQTDKIFVMDGSKRSRHSNAFFTGLGRSRRIVLFDTLVKQLSIPELSAVLAHEVGHYKRKHIAKGLMLSVLSTLVGFLVLHAMVSFASFNEAFGLIGGNAAQTLLLVSLLGGTITFYFSPVWNIFSRKNEYEADAYAKKYADEKDLISALQKLYKENLANLHPHPAYRFFYYSHPTIQERAARLLHTDPETVSLSS